MGCVESRTQSKTIFSTNSLLLIIFIAECHINTKSCQNREAQLTFRRKNTYTTSSTKSRHVPLMGKTVYLRILH